MRALSRPLVGCVLMMALGACTETPAIPTQPLPPPVDLVVSATEWRFVPARVTTGAGGTMTVELRNDGVTVHDWTVISEPVTTESEYDEDIRIAAVTAVPGAKARVTFDLPAPGEYQVICTIPGHLSSGMEGTFAVVEG